MTQIISSECYNYFERNPPLHRVHLLNEITFSNRYKTYFPKVVAKFKHKGFPLEDAKEMAQEVFYLAYKKKHQLKSDSETSFLAWLNTIVLTVWKNTLRSRKAIKREGEEISIDEKNLGLETNEANPLEDVLHGESLSDIRMGIVKLPARQRAVLTLRIFHDLSYQEIAIIMKTNVSIVRNLLYQGRTNLRQALENRHS